MSGMLDFFTLTRYRFTIEALQAMDLPSYKGTTLRGGFGITFRRLVCYQPHVPRCDDCLLRFSCPYPYLFDTYPPPDAEVLGQHQDVPLPLVIEPPNDRRRHLEPGDTLEFHVILVGESVRYLSYLAVAFQELGRQGLGKARGRFKLCELTAVHPYRPDTAIVYEENSPNVIRAATLPITFAECATRAVALPPDRVTVHFQTPTRLKDAGLIIRETPPFLVFWRALMRRVSSLAYFHCGQQWEADYRGLLQAAKEVQLVDAGTHWAEFRRYSTRQQQGVSFGGVVGSATYAGDLRPFLPVLALGELVHVGKSTVFGNGRFRLSAP